jgi:hypothetical protein
MPFTLRFHRVYFLLSLLLLGAEIFIGARLHDGITRLNGGDYLVVIWLYCLVRSFCDSPVLPTALSVLAFAYIVEFSQYFKLADHLGFGAHSLARVLVGDYFSWLDMLAYTLGILSVLGIEATIKKTSNGAVRS